MVRRVSSFQPSLNDDGATDSIEGLKDGRSNLKNLSITQNFIFCAIPS